MIMQLQHVDTFTGVNQVMTVDVRSR